MGLQIYLQICRRGILMKSEFFKEEIREGFTVSAEMKKVWAVEMKVLSFVISVCKKYDIPYFADYGT